jgi:hypothetical protein
MRKPIYIYDRNFSRALGAYDINHSQRIDQRGKKVILNQETLKAFPNNYSRTNEGVNSDPNLEGIFFTSLLSVKEEAILDTIVYNHQNNIPDKYAIKLEDGSLLKNPTDEETYLFDTKEKAEQAIVNAKLINAVSVGVVVL